MPTSGMGSPRIGVHRVPEVVHDADVHRRVVHVVLDALAEHELQPDHVAARSA